MKHVNLFVVRVNKKGFTLIEIMVASIIGALIAVIAVGTLRAVSISSEKINHNIDKTAELRFISKTIADDLKNIYRDRNFKNMLFTGTIEMGPQGEFTSLKFYTVSRSKARWSEPEGDVYEVEYYTMQTEQANRLMRRIWPNPDKENEPGGLLTAIGNDVEIFSLRFFDGSQWQDEWDEQRNNLPDLVEIIIGLKIESEEKPMTETMMINFVRNAGRSMGQIKTSEKASQTEITDE